MGKLLDELRNFLRTASKEEIDEAWKEVEQFKDVGPTVTEFVESQKQMLEDNDNEFDFKSLCSVSPDCNMCYRKDDCLIEATRKAWKDQEKYTYQTSQM